MNRNGNREHKESMAREREGGNRASLRHICRQSIHTKKILATPILPGLIQLIFFKNYLIILYMRLVSSLCKIRYFSINKLVGLCTRTVM